MTHVRRARGAFVPRCFLYLLAFVVGLSVPSTVGADCDSTQFASRLGPPGMAQPDGNFQTIAGDCTGVPDCGDFFDILLEDGDILSLSFCSNGGSSSFDTELAVLGSVLEYGSNQCASYECANGAEMIYEANETGIHRIRIGHGDFQTPVDGTYVLAYSAPAGRLIAPASCGDGVLDAGEECDDGNGVDGDCCSRACTYEALDAVCGDEGNDCTFDRCDGAGTCTHPNKGSGTVCDDGEAFFCTADTCDGAGTCTHVDIPGCDMLPDCALPQPHLPVTYPHPKSGIKFEASLVQSFVGCNNPGGNTPNATTETGTVPSCFPAETFDEDDGSPPGGWHWGPYGKGAVKFANRCKDAGDVLIKFAMYNIVDGGGALVNGSGTFAIAARFTILDSGGVPMTTIDVPLSFQFNVVSGSTKVLTSVNAMLSDQGLESPPNGFTFTLAPVNPLDGGFLEIRDSNGNSFARPGIYLP